MGSIFQSIESRNVMLKWYDKFLNLIDYPVESRFLETSFGRTHLLEGGAKSAPPLVLLHGAMASSAHVLYEAEDLVRNFHVYAIDIIGQSPKSEDRRLSVKNNDYGKWLIEVFDALKLQQPSVVGVSWGGFTALRAAAHSPERVGKMMLIVPAGVVNGSPWEGLVKMAVPLYLYRRKPVLPRLDLFTKNLLTTQDDDWQPFIGDAVLAYRNNMSIPSLLQISDLKNFHSPVYVMAAENDVSFPAKKLLARSAKLFPNLAGTEVIPGSNHCPPTTKAFMNQLCEKIYHFMLKP